MVIFFDVADADSTLMNGNAFIRSPFLSKIIWNLFTLQYSTK